MGRYYQHSIGIRYEVNSYSLNIIVASISMPQLMRAGMNTIVFYALELISLIANLLQIADFILR
jgi:hypothetical protein